MGMSVRHTHTTAPDASRGDGCGAHVRAGTAALVGAPAASAGSVPGGYKACPTGQVVVTRTHGAGAHNHRFDFGGIPRPWSVYTPGIAKKNHTWSARVVDYWYVAVTAMVEDGYSGAVCVS